MRRIFPFFLTLACGAWAYACSSSDSANTPPQGPDGGGTDTNTTNTDTDSGPQDQDTGTDSPVSDGTPYEGFTPTQIKDTGQFTTSPKFQGNKLYVALPLDSSGAGLLLRMDPDGLNDTPIRPGDGVTYGVTGNAIEKGGALISTERKVVTRTLDGGTEEDIIAQFQPDGGGAPLPFNTPRNLVARTSDDMIYFTDPGYFEGAATVDYIFRFKPGGADTAAAVIDEFPFRDGPNGIALSKDQKTLFVAFTNPAPAGTAKPFIRKYTIATNGDTSAPTTFATFTTADASPENLAVDDDGNVYVAWKSGINVYKADGSLWGTAPSIPITMGGKTVGVGFGGADRKTLYVTTDGGKVFKGTVKVPGLL